MATNDIDNAPELGGCETCKMMARGFEVLCGEHGTARVDALRERLTRGSAARASQQRPPHLPDPAVAYALHDVGHHLEVFARIGRWGTCGFCPQSGGKVFPEFCEETRRYDHQLKLADLVFQYERALQVGRERAARDAETARGL